MISLKVTHILYWMKIVSIPVKHHIHRGNFCIIAKFSTESVQTSSISLVGKVLNKVKPLNDQYTFIWQLKSSSYLIHNLHVGVWSNKPTTDYFPLLWMIDQIPLKLINISNQTTKLTMWKCLVFQVVRIIWVKIHYCSICPFNWKINRLSAATAKRKHFPKLLSKGRVKLFDFKSS